MSRPDHIACPAAWYGADMAANRSRWTHDLSASEISELESAAKTFIAREHDIGSISPETFPLPSLAKRMLELRSDLQDGIGFGLISGLPVTRYDMATAAVIFCGIGAHLGIARSQNAKGHILGHVYGCWC